MALADAPVVQCKDMAQALPPGDRSVVWVSPLQRRARGWLTVMDAGTLRQWVEQEDPDEGQFLFHLGLRRNERTPHRRYKVVIFDTKGGDLCLPSTQPDPLFPFACGRRGAGPESGQDACGRIMDPTTGEVGMPTYRGRWRELARRGYCLLPLTRFLDRT